MGTSFFACIKRGTHIFNNILVIRMLHLAFICLHFQVAYNMPKGKDSESKIVVNYLWLLIAICFQANQLTMHTN